MIRRSRDSRINSFREMTSSENLWLEVKVDSWRSHLSTNFYSRILNALLARTCPDYSKFPYGDQWKKSIHQEYVIQSLSTFKSILRDHKEFPKLGKRINITHGTFLLFFRQRLAPSNDINHGEDSQKNISNGHMKNVK